MLIQSTDGEGVEFSKEQVALFTIITHIESDTTENSNPVPTITVQTPQCKRQHLLTLRDIIDWLRTHTEEEEERCVLGIQKIIQCAKHQEVDLFVLVRLCDFLGSEKLLHLLARVAVRCLPADSLVLHQIFAAEGEECDFSEEEKQQVIQEVHEYARVLPPPVPSLDKLTLFLQTPHVN